MKRIPVQPLIPITIITLFNCFLNRLLNILVNPNNANITEKFIYQ